MKVQHRHIQSMGTRFDLVLPGLSEAVADRIFGDLSAELCRIEQLLSIHRKDSLLSVINRNMSSGYLLSNPEMEAIIRDFLRYHVETGGYFDPSLKPLQEYYRALAGGETADSREVKMKVGMSKISMEGGRVISGQKGMVLDPGGYGKGYAVKRLLPLLENYKLKHALISFGESLVYGFGSHPHGESWRIAVPGEGVDEDLFFDLRDQALSTSGNSLNNQKKFANSGHIVNPFTLEIVNQPGLVSVKSEDPVECEVYSTALFSAGPQNTARVLKMKPGLEYHWTGAGMKEKI